MDLLRTIRKLVLGETWVLPVAVGAALAVAGIVRAVAGADSWWRSAGGFVLLGLVACGYVAATRSGHN